PPPVFFLIKRRPPIGTAGGSLLLCWRVNGSATVAYPQRWRVSGAAAGAHPQRWRVNVTAPVAAHNLVSRLLRDK
ncbi:hypothetical protein DU496_30095, partial [Klebsiella pneumoniae]|nr:hypothetical protein [Klebsiella pneumoniae]